MKIHDVEQSSIEWLKLHVGIPTAGGLDNLLTPEFELRKGETPRTYVYKKVAEAWRGKPLVDLSASSWAMEQGLILESEAIPFYELTTGRKITRVGFITTDDGRFGCSPDGLILSGGLSEPKRSRSKDDLHINRNADTWNDSGNSGGASSSLDEGKAGSVNKFLAPPAQTLDCGIEIKCPSPHVHVKYLTEGVVPKEYRAQVQGGMFATGFSKWIFVSYCRGFPPLILEVMRDEKQQNAICNAVDNFHNWMQAAKKILERFHANPLNEFK